MSIINDALKKAQVNLTLHNNKSSAAASETARQSKLNERAITQPVIRKAESSTQVKLQPSGQGQIGDIKDTYSALIYRIFLIVCGVAALIFAFYQRIQPDQTTMVPIRPATETSALAQTPPAAATAIGYRTDIPFQLDGIMMMGGTRIAMIDDLVFEEGDEYNGLKILRITENSVAIQYEGEEKVLRVVGKKIPD